MFKIKRNDIYQLRGNDHKLFPEETKADFKKKSFSYRGTTAWNNLSYNIVNRYKQLSNKSFKTIISNDFNLTQNDS